MDEREGLLPQHPAGLHRVDRPPVARRHGECRVKRASKSTYRINDAGCWIWQGRLVPRGDYGLWGYQLAHRRMYADLVGPIPDGLELDHLCRVTTCVNPAHLEPVTPAENRRRRYALITECVHGHPYDSVNTYWRPSGQRDCRTCIRDRSRRYSRRQRAA
ncbi:MAG: HNH endonuclease signature motif containing protein [Motilibacteraceae bacterium]